MGAFDDLIPQQSGTGGAFDDLIPQEQPKGFLDTAADVTKRLAGAVTDLIPGMVDPIVGAAQLGANLVGAGEPVNKAVDQYNKWLESKGVDEGIRAAGAMLSPVPLAAASKIPVFAGAKGVLPNVAQLAKNVGVGAATGAGFGALNPVVGAGDDFTGEKLGQMGVGAAVGGVVPALGTAVVGGTKVTGSLVDAIRGRLPALQAAKAVRATLPDEAAARAVLANAPDDLTAAQALQQAGIIAPRTQALGVRAAAGDADYYAGLQAQQEAARLAALQEVAGGRSQSDVLAAIKSAQDDLNKLTGPMREQVLKKVNLVGQVENKLQRRLSERETAYVSALQNQGRMQTEAAQALTLPTPVRPTDPQVVRNLPSGNFPQQPALEPITKGISGVQTADGVEIGMPRLSPQYTPSAQMAESFASAADELGQIATQRRQQIAQTVQQLEGLGARNLQPLNAEGIISKLQAKLTDPGAAGSKKYGAVIDRVIQDISDWTAANGGRIDANALYAIRKNSVNDAIEDLLRGVDPKSSAKFAAKILGEVAPAIDDALKSAGGTGWKDYLKTYASGMDDIAQQKMSGRLLELYKDSPKRFVKTVTGDKPKEVEKVFGKGRTDIGKEMGEKITPAQKVSAELTRDLEMSELAQAGKEGATKALQDVRLSARLPAFFDKWITAANKGLATTEERIGVKTLEALTEGMKTGKNLNKMLMELPAVERNKVLMSMMKFEKTSPYVTGSAVGATD